MWVPSPQGKDHRGHPQGVPLRGTRGGWGVYPVCLSPRAMIQRPYRPRRGDWLMGAWGAMSVRAKKAERFCAYRSIFTFAPVNNESRSGAGVARWAHNPKVVSSNLTSATNKSLAKPRRHHPCRRGFLFICPARHALRHQPAALQAVRLCFIHYTQSRVASCHTHPLTHVADTHMSYMGRPI